MRALRNTLLTGLLIALCGFAAAGANLQGVVTAVRGNVVELSVGSKDGVKRGMVFVVKSRAGQVARVEVTAVKPTRSTGRVLQKKGVIAVGDAVELEKKSAPQAKGQPTMTVVRTLSLADESAAPADPSFKFTPPIVESPPPDELRELVAAPKDTAPKPPAPAKDSAPAADTPPAKKAETVSVTQRIARVESAVVLVEVSTPSALYWTTGVVVSQDGYVVTCGEYLALSSTVHVYLKNDRRYPAKVMDKEGRLALLKLGVLTPDLAAVELQETSGLEPGTPAMALGYHLPPLMVLHGLSFKATTAWGVFSDFHRREKANVIEADMEPDIGFLGAPVFRMDTGQLAGLIVSIRTRSEDDAHKGLGYGLHRTLTLLSPVDTARELLKANGVHPALRDEVAVIPEDAAPALLPPGDLLNLRLLPPQSRELPSLFHQRYRLGLGSSYREDIVSDACHRFLGRVPSAVSEPAFDRDTLFFGSINGRFYAFDPLRGEAETFLANEGVAFLYAPTMNREVVCATAGAVNLSARARSTLFKQLAAMTARVLTAGVVAPQVQSVVPDLNDTGLLYVWDRATGDVRWVYRTRFLGAPKMVGNRVYFAGLGVLGALDVETGAEIWTPKLLNPKKKDKDLTWYHIAYVDEHNLYVTAIPVELCMEEQYQVCAAGAGDAQLQCLDPDTGKVKWQQKITTLDAAHTALSAAFVYQPEDQTLWSLIGPNVITADLNTRKKVREYKKELQGVGKSSAPLGMACGSGILYLTSDQNLLYAVNAETGADIWAKPFAARGKIGAPVVVKNRVYVGSSDGTLYCLDAAQGSLVWKAKTGGTLLAKPVVVGRQGVRDDAIYCVSDEGDVHVIRVPREVDYQPLERKPTVELKRSGLELRK